MQVDHRGSPRPRRSPRPAARVRRARSAPRRPDRPVRLHDVLVASRHRTTLDSAHGARRPNTEFSLRPLQEVAMLFRDCPDAVATAGIIADRCRAFDLTRDLGYGFPDFRGADRTPAPRALAELCRSRLEQRYAQGSENRSEAERRLEQELTLIEHHRL